jgi:hypothetical protein
MTLFIKSTAVLPIVDKWFELTPGERFTIRSSVTETEGKFTMLELGADSRNGVPMLIHKNEEEHFIVLGGTFTDNTAWDVASARDAGLINSFLQPLDKRFL